MFCRASAGDVAVVLGSSVGVRLLANMVARRGRAVFGGAVWSGVGALAQVASPELERVCGLWWAGGGGGGGVVVLLVLLLTPFFFFFFFLLLLLFVVAVVVISFVVVVVIKRTLNLAIEVEPTRW